ncbi:CaiB/BaiF CoA-transferase family protein [Maritimibacter sp. HL-12]|uniref:CaiB/BaiF CoA transferase family protein n=1 Tax=Maritimibacter sp. HL-12 TaxID=1162418 RepID=UPI000A0F16FB|nr:CaiB/BaiF CoA-transferase family protein [Maritimibacter sp. HL-12]SMH38371.1 Crotonobetainyl-CoA:carnitine CoA-transferase CaiB [Maritimibacter sp. HL-12]
MGAPLEGIRVLDLSRILAGPFAGQTFADLGAEVIKVEAPGGDDTRTWGPPFIAREDDRSAAYYYAANRGKKSVVADFTTPEGRDFVRSLAVEADVLIENFKFGGLAKYALDYEALAKINPRLVYCSITGFGQTGPYADRAGYDYLIQGMSGLMSITGEPEGDPQRVGVAVTDLFSGLYAVIGVLSALRERDRTGMGQQVDIALLDSAAAMLANQAMNYFATGDAPGRIGNQHPNIVPYQVVPVSDGSIIIAVGNDRQYRNLCDVLARPELASDPDFATNRVRVANRDKLIPLLSAETRRWTKAALLAALDVVKVPAGPINSIAEILDDPQIEARGMRIKPGGVEGLRTPILFSRSALAIDKTAPSLDEHGEAVRGQGFTSKV